MLTDPNYDHIRKNDRVLFPFTSIIGQEEMKLALLLNIIDPKIGGVMIMGDRGTGKTTAVRSLIDILPEIEVVKDDCFNSHPFDPDLMNIEIQDKIDKKISFETVFKPVPLIDLPLGATEDRLCGTIDLEKAFSKGVKSFEPGLLAKANRGILYVDEVNLLDDHLVDILLDAAASGWNTVEREGISVKHPSRFVLIGSGNPEEGELRPQLLDRFGMHAEIKTIKEANLRVMIVEQRIEFDNDPLTYILKFRESQEKLRKQILFSRNILPKISISSNLKTKISMICSELGVDGLRGDIVMNRAAKAHAAIRMSEIVTIDDIKNTIVLCLRHRLRKDPLETIDSGFKVKKFFKEVFKEEIN